MKNIAADFNISNSIFGSKTKQKDNVCFGANYSRILERPSWQSELVKEHTRDRAVPSLQYILNSDILNSEYLNLEVQYGRS
jgi:hypothetical protein